MVMSRSIDYHLSDAVMATQPDLVETRDTLKQVVGAKG
jgi:hypothetical protein